MESYRLLASVLNTEHDTPDIIWNKDMRQRLLDHLSNELEPYVKARASDPMAPYVHILRPRIEYPELAGTCSGDFLFHFCEWLRVLMP